MALVLFRVMNDTVLLQNKGAAPGGGLFSCACALLPSAIDPGAPAAAWFCSRSALGSLRLGLGTLLLPLFPSAPPATTCIRCVRRCRCSGRKWILKPSSASSSTTCSADCLLLAVFVIALSAVAAEQGCCPRRKLQELRPANTGESTQRVSSCMQSVGRRHLANTRTLYFAR